jgi:hypothetical protein
VKNMLRFYVARLESSLLSILVCLYIFIELRKEDLQPFIEKIIKRIAGWKGRLLSYACRLMLLKACLVSTPIYLLSIVKFPKQAIEMINSQMTRFPWNNNEDKHKYHLANW